jgi:hypothetical protein
MTLISDAVDAAGYFDSQRVQHLLRKIEHGPVIGFKDNMAFLAILSTQL